MGSAAGTGDDDLVAIRLGRGGKFEHEVGRAVGRNHARFIGHAEIGQHLRGRLHHRPIAIRTHDNGDRRLLFVRRVVRHLYFSLKTWNR